MLPGPSEHRGKSLEDEVSKMLAWRKRAPKFTTFRVNSLVTSTTHFMELLKLCLLQLSEERSTLGVDSSLPQIWHHHLVPEAIAFGSWKRMGELPRHELEVIVDVACGAAVLRGAHVFVPGVIGLLQGASHGDKVSIYADLRSLCTRGCVQKLDEDSRFFVGNGTLLLDRKQIFAENGVSEGVAVHVTENESGCPSLPPNSFPPGLAVLQNLPSIVCGRVLNPQVGDIILDMCAAPGNKTTHLAALMNNQGVIIALDRSASRITKLRQLCKDLSVKNVTVFVCNSIYAAKPKEELVSQNGPNLKHILNAGPPFPWGVFDKILLDSPCSGLGQRPRLERIDLKHILSLPPLQKKLFETAVKLLKPGGILVYSTCTVIVGENEGLVRWALDNFSCLELVPADPCLHPFLSEDSCSDTLSPSEMKCVQKYVPSVDDGSEDTLCEKDTIGFFIAQFKKKM